MKDHLPNRSFMGGLIVGAMLFGAFMAVGIWITVRIPVALNTPPIRYAESQFVGSSEFCPGDTLNAQTQVQFDRPSIVQTFITLRDAGTGRNVPGMQSQMPTRLQPELVTFHDVYTMTLPNNLPAGNYEYIRTTVAVNMDANPAWMVLPFTVKESEECPSKGADK